MSRWPDTRITQLFAIANPIIQAPMAGASTPEMAVAAQRAGALGSLPCATLSPDEARAAITTIAAANAGPLNVNFFCHTPPRQDAEVLARWSARLGAYYREAGIDPSSVKPGAGRAPFDARYCALVEELRPAVVSFHFGLPEQNLVDRVRAAGSAIIASATTVTEARWLADHGVDAVIAMGSEAGGHRGNFLTDAIAQQVGTFALLPQVADAVRIPVIAAGGIADARGVVAAFALGAAAVQIGTAYLRTPEAKTSPAHRQALAEVRDDGTVITNVFTGRPARGIRNRLIDEVGPMSDLAPPFPLATAALAPLRAVSETDFANFWAGQAAPLATTETTQAFTERIARDALALFSRIGGT